MKGIIFDLDGTLAYTMDDLAAGMNAMLRQNGLPECSVAQLLANINHGAREFVRLSLPEAYRTDEDFVSARLKEYDRYYGAHFLDTTYAYPGVTEALAELRRMGVKLAVLSNKQHPRTAALCAHLFPAGTFEVVMGHAEYPTKPDPAAALAIAGQFGLEVSEIAFVGDSDVDMDTAHNAGMTAVGVSWGFRSADFLREHGAQYLIARGEDLAVLASDFDA